MSHILKDGWYRVILENQNPDKDEVERFEEWVELVSGIWDYLNDYPKCLVVEVIRPEPINSQSAKG